MSIIETIGNRNGYLLCEKVFYGETNNYDPNDTSNVWYRVILGYKGISTYAVAGSIDNNDEDIQPGDLVRFPPRHVSEEIINGETFYSFNQTQVSFIIKKADVKENLLK